MTLPFVILNSSFGISPVRLATAQKTVERLTPATLAKAFRGDLVPREPNDEPASVLLERLAAGRDEPPSPKRKQTKRVRYATL